MFLETIGRREKTKKEAKREREDRKNEKGRNIFNKEGETRQSKSPSDVGTDESCRYSIIMYPQMCFQILVYSMFRVLVCIL